MCQDTVLKLQSQHLRESRNGTYTPAHHLGTNNNMPQQLAVIRIIILRETGQFLCLTDVMENGCCQQQIPVELRIVGSIIITKLCHAQGMLQKSAHKSMMDAFCSGVELECLCKGRAVHKINT